MTPNDTMLETSRLILTPLRPGDERWLWPMLSSPLTLWAWPQLFDQAGVTGWIERSQEAERRFGLGRHLVRLREEGTVVGDCGFFPWHWEGRCLIDAGWITDHRHWRRGYATEAMRTLLPALFASGHRTVWAKLAADNHGSRVVAEALDFALVRSFRYDRNRWAQTLLYRADAAPPLTLSSPR